VPVSNLARLKRSTVIGFFHKQHADKYGFADRDAEVELVNLRLEGYATVEPPAMPPAEKRRVGAPRGETHPVSLPGAEECLFLRREELLAGDQLEGPAVITEATATTFLPPGWRLEVDKLRRVEKDWLQVLVRMLDHVYALHQGALRSGQPNLIGQLGAFQHACRDAARRVGLAPFTADESEPFDEQRHQLTDGDHKAAAHALVAETLATGYTFQGQLIRPALVRLRNGQAEAEELPLETAQKV